VEGGGRFPALLSLLAPSDREQPQDGGPRLVDADVGERDLGAANVPPPLDTPIIKGDLGFHYHSGGHAATPADWRAFLEFAGKYLK